jgi:hypothetical protein
MPPFGYINVPDNRDIGTGFDTPQTTGNWRSRAVAIETPETSPSNWRLRAEPVANPMALEIPEHSNAPATLVNYLAPAGIPSDLLDMGVTPGNAAKWADLHIQKAEQELGTRLDPGRQQAIFDIYKQVGGREDLSRRDYTAEQRQQRLAERRETLGGRVMDASAAFARNLATTGTSLIGAVAPETAEDLQQDIDAQYAYDPESRAAFAGGLAAEAVKLGTVGRAGALTGRPALTMAGFYGGQGFGGSRQRAEQLRRGGQEVSLGQELGTAAGVGGIEALSGAVGAKIFGAMGRQLNRLGGVLSGATREAGQTGLRAAVRQGISSAARAGGLAFAEGAEEAATQVVTNKITQLGMDPKQAVLEGLGEAFAMGVLLSPIGAGSVQAPTRIPGSEPVDPMVEDMIRETPQTVDGETGTLALPPGRAETRFEVGPEGQTRDLTGTLGLPARPEPEGSVPFATHAGRMFPRKAVFSNEKTRPIRKVARFTGTEEGPLEDTQRPLQPVPTGQERFEARFPEQAAQPAPEQAPAAADVPSSPLLGRTEEGAMILQDRDVAEAMVQREYQDRLNDEEVQALIEQGMSEEQAIETAFGSVPSMEEGSGVLADTYTVNFQPEEQAAPQPQQFTTEGIPATPEEQIAPEARELRDAVQQVVGDQTEVRIVDDLPGARGFYDADTGTMYVRNDENQTGMFEALVHESMHASGLDVASEIGSPRLRKQLARDYLQNFEEFARRNPDSPQVQSYVQKLRDDPAMQEREAVATLGGRLATDPTFAAQLSKRSPTFVQKVVNAIRRAINTITGKQKDIDRLAREMLAKIEANTGMTAEAPAEGGFLPGRKYKETQPRPQSLRREISELKGKLSRASDPETIAAIRDDLAQKRMSLEQIEGRRSSFLPDNMQKPGTRPSRGRFTLPQGLEDFVAPISTRLLNISPSLYKRLQRFELRSRVQREDLQRVVGDFLRKKNDALSAEQQKQFTLLTANGKFDEATELLRSVDPSLVQGFSDARNVLNSIYAAAKRAGIDVGFRENYWPREVTDYKEWRKQVRGDEPGEIRDAIKAAEDRRGRELNASEEIEIVNRVLQGYGPRKPGDTKPRAFRGRTQEEITEDMLDLYRDADHAIMGYINRATHSIEKARFFGKGEVGEDILDSIGRYTADLVANGEITADEERTVKNLLASRFTTGESSPNGLIRTMRDAGYLTVLANPISAVTQLGDLFLAGYRSGTIPALKALTRRKRVKMESLGIERIAAEFANPGKMAKALDTAMRAAGFTRIDRLGKETLLNAALNRYERAARNPKSRQSRQFRREYGPVFGPEFDSLMDDLANDRITENVRLLLFMELAGIQPISLSEMPKKYLDAPNGRIFYMLKTFTIKQLDLLRRNSFAKMNRGEVQEGATDLLRYAMIFGIGNAGADILKDWLLGRDVKWTDLAIDGMLRLFGGNKFLLDSAAKNGPGEAFFNMLMPPTNVLDDAVRDVSEIPDIWSGEEGVSSIRNIPLFGKVLYWRAGEGKQRAEDEQKTVERRRRDEIRDAAIEALDQQDRTSAEAIVEKWNTEERPEWMEELTMRSIVTSRRSRISSAFSRAKESAAEALLQGDRDKARRLIEEHNAQDPPRKLTMRHAEVDARRMRARGKTQ